MHIFGTVKMGVVRDNADFGAMKIGVVRDMPIFGPYQKGTVLPFVCRPKRVLLFFRSDAFVCFSMTS